MASFPNLSLSPASSSHRFYNPYDKMPYLGESSVFQSPPLHAAPQLLERLENSHPEQEVYPTTFDGDALAKDSISFRLAQLAAEHDNRETDQEKLRRLNQKFPLTRRDMHPSLFLERGITDKDKRFVDKLKITNPSLYRKAQTWLSLSRDQILHELAGNAFQQVDIRRLDSEIIKPLGSLHFALNLLHHLNPEEKRSYIQRIARGQKDSSYFVVGMTELDVFKQGKYLKGWADRIGSVMRHAGYVPDIELNKGLSQVPSIDDRHPIRRPKFIYRKDASQAAKEIKLLQEQAARMATSLWRKRKTQGRRALSR